MLKSSVLLFRTLAMRAIPMSHHGSMSTTWTAAAVFGLLFAYVLPDAMAQTIPCGRDTISINIPEYPNVEGVVTIPVNERNTYRSQIVETDNSGLLLTITEDVDNPPPPELRPDSTTLEVVYNALSTPRGFDLILKKGVDRDGISASGDDDINTLQYKLECVDPSVPNTVFYHVLKIQITVLNDNAPKFLDGPYAVTVNELTPVGIVVFSMITTTDLDNGNNKLVKYSMDTASSSLFTDNSVFQLASEDSPHVVLRQPLDYEAMVPVGGAAPLTVYRLNITATDQGSPTQSSWVYLNITITDGDDLGPVFVYDSCPRSQNKGCVRPKYSASIESGTTTPVVSSLPVLPIPRLADPTQTVSIVARDGDSLNASIQCSIAYTSPAGYESRFAVSTTRVDTSSNHYQCNVRVSTPINSAELLTLDIVLLATEQTRNSYTEAAVITLDITPSNQNPPTTPTPSGSLLFTEQVYTFYLEENPSSSFYVGKVSVAVADKQNASLGTIRFSIQPPSSELANLIIIGKSFGIEPTTGQINTLRSLDLSDPDRLFTFTVIATDGDVRSGMTQVVVIPKLPGREGESSANIGPIIGAVVAVGLVLAVIIIAATLYLRYRHSLAIREEKSGEIQTEASQYGGSIYLEPVVPSNAAEPEAMELWSVQGGPASSDEGRPTQENGRPPSTVAGEQPYEILDDQAPANYDRPQMYENTRGHHVYTDLTNL